MRPIFNPNPVPFPRPFPSPPANPNGIFNTPIRIPSQNSQIQPYRGNNFPSPNNTLPRGGLPDGNTNRNPIETWNLNPRIPTGNRLPNNGNPTINIPVNHPIPNRPGIPWRNIFRRAFNETWDSFFRQREPSRFEDLFGTPVPDPVPPVDMNVPEPTIPTPSGRSSPFGVPRGTYEIKIEFEAHTQKFAKNIYTGQTVTNYTANVSSNFTTLKGKIVNPVEMKQVPLEPTGGQKYFEWVIVATSLILEGVTIQGVDLGNGLKEFTVPYGRAGIYTGEFYSYPAGFDTRGFEVTNKNLKVELKGEEQPDPRPYVNRAYPQIEEEENMRCQTCEAARVIRSLQKTITVDSTTISSIPTGNLVVAPTVQKPVRVFCLPGTEDSIKQQFNLIDEVRKRLAKTFNQSRMAKVLARISQIMNFTQFWLTFHNALMMSADIGETFFGAIFQTLNNVAKIADDTPLGSFYDLDETPFDSQELITSKLEEWAKQIFGVQNWSEIKSKFAALNQIIRSTNTMVMNMRDLGESQRDLAEMSAERVGKLNNALRKAGITFDEGNWMSEDVNMRSRFLEKLEKIEESGVINTAVFFQSLSQQALDVQETKKEVAESKQKFREDLTKGISTITGQATDSKTASQGADISKEDIAK